MKLTKVERLLLINQYNILIALSPDMANDYRSQITALENGYESEWTPRLMSVVTEEETSAIIHILWIYEQIQDALPDDDSARFPGFHGNGDSAKYLWFLRYLQDDNRFTNVKCQFLDCNSHGNEPVYADIAKRYDEIGELDKGCLTAEQARTILEG